MGTIEAVVFDWGGTLSLFADVDVADMWRLAASHLASQHSDGSGVAALEADLFERMVAVEQASWDRIEVDQSTTTLSALIAEASTALGLDVGEALLEEAGTHYLDAWATHIRHDPDCVPVLAALRAQGLRLGLLSNTHWPRAFHDHFLERDGILPLLDARLYTCEMERSKPHHSAFRAVLDALGVEDPTHAVFVGDRPYDDIAGAQGLGMKAVHRPNHLVPDHDVIPDATITALPELLEIVASWA